MKIASFNRFEIEMPDDAVADCHHQGACDADVEHWSTRIPRPIEVTPDLLKSELDECGAWNDEELADDAANWRRILWIAAGNIQDEEHANP